MRVQKQILTPGVKYTEEADLGTQVRRIGSDCSQCLGRGTEKDVIDLCFVLIGDGCDLLRHGEDDMEVFGLEQF